MDFSIYPNPLALIDSSLTLKITTRPKENSPATLSIHSVDGQLIWQKTYDTITQNQLIQLKNSELKLAIGVYKVTLKMQAHLVSIKYVYPFLPIENKI